MALTRFNDLRHGGYSARMADHVQLRREHGDITTEDRRRSEHAFQLRKSTLDQIRYSIGEAGKICVRILYSTDGITIEHFKECFIPEFDMSRVTLRDHTLVVTIPFDSWKYLKRAFDSTHIRDVYRELSHYFSEYGMIEYFEHLRDVYFTYYDHGVRGEREALQGIRKTLALQKKANDQRRAHEQLVQRRKEESDFREIRNYKARELGRLGKV